MLNRHLTHPSATTKKRRRRKKKSEAPPGVPQNGNPKLANLTAIGAAATTLIGVVSALAVTGVLQRAQRNEGGLLGIAFVLVIAAAMGWVIAWLLKPETLGRVAGAGRVTERLLSALAVVAFSVGLILAVLAIIKTQQQTQRPTIEAQIGKNAELTATVHASDLTADSRIVICVDGLRPNPNAPGRYRTVKRLYQAYLGPDSDGAVKEPLTVEIPSSQYSAVGLRAWTTSEEPPCEFSDIDPKKTGTRLGAACVILPLPRVVARPQLVAAWGTGAERRTLHVTASTTQAPPARLVVQRVVAQRTSTTVELARPLAEPDANGKAQVATGVAVPKGVCTSSASTHVSSSRRRWSRACNARPIERGRPPLLPNSPCRRHI